MTRRSISDLLGLHTPGGADEERPRPEGALPLRAGRGRDLALVGGAYEGASNTNRDLALWSPPLRSADADMLYERDNATARARDVMRNDAYVQSGEHLHRDGVVGSYFLLNAKPNTRALGIEDKDGTWEQEFQEEVEALFTLWAESPDNWPDASRMNTLTGLVRLAIGVYLASGEVLASCEWIRATAARPYRTAIQMIESDRLSNPYGTISAGTLRGGVERDRYGAPVSYWIRESHPSDYQVNSLNWKNYPARMAWGRQRVIHIFEQARVDQTRGISDLTTALKEMRVTKRFRDIVLQNAVLNASVAASIEAELPGQHEGVLGNGDDTDLVSWAENYLGAVNDFSGGSKSLTIDGVRIPHLFPGQKLQLRPAGQGGPLGTEFEASLLRYIAANLGVSYEELSRDYSQSNYSSMRAAMIQTWKFMQARKKMVADRFATHIYRLWFEEAVNAGIITTLKGRPDFYEGMNKDAYTQCDWLGAGRGQIDELKETQAAVLRINNNLSTLEIELARAHGLDWRAVLKQKAREKTMVDELGLAPVVDPNMENALSGSPREPGEDGEPKEKKKDVTDE